MAKVLHIEDDPSSRLLVQKILTAAGHQVTDAESGVEGIHLAEEIEPDIVLVDINVPDLDGYEVTLRLRGMPGMQGKPIVAITAEGDKETSLAVGADGFVEKPIDTRGFPALIAKYLDGYSERMDANTGEILRVQSQKLVERLEAKMVELYEANRQLEEAARLRQEFFQNLSHEFATPMTPVVGYLRLLLGEEVGPLTALQRKCLGSVQTSTDKLRALVDTLLDISHLETGRLHLFARDYDFAQVLTKAIQVTKARFADAHVTVHQEGLDRPMLGRGDPDKLRRAMVHILDNAAKFTPRRGDVAVKAFEFERDGEPRFGVAVMDSGPGISGDDRKRIFQTFVQLDGSRTRTFGGVGLGLAYARHVAEAMGGSIEVESPPSEAIAGQMLSGTTISMSVVCRAQLTEPAV